MKHRFSLRLVKADQKDPDFQKYFQESYAVYKKYQRNVHNDTEEECSKDTFKGFLCDSPLAYQHHNDKDNKLMLGAFHQHYLIDDKIVAVGVIDILPDCVSSVYFYYDPDYSHLSLGTYSAIREIQLCQALGLPFYYMGYYIHSCPKMRYKGKYSPSDLLCPETYKWCSIDQCLPKLEKKKYTTFFEDCSVVQQRSKVMLNKVRLFMDGDVFIYREGFIRTLPEEEQRRVADYLEKCGNLAESIILVIIVSDSD